jgi:hypothetical protein
MSQDEKLIEWAFLCAAAQINQRGGLNITHLHDKFNHSDLASLTLVVCLTFEQDHPGRLQPLHHAIIDTFELALILQDDTGAQIHAETFESLVTKQMLLVPLGNAPLQKAGRYTLQLFADGALQQTLFLFLLD